jgi:hypothetical protein
MKRMPSKIYLLFKEEHHSAEKTLLAWLVNTKVEEFDCSKSDLAPSQIARIANAVANSQVQSVNLSWNQLREHGP